MLVPPPSNWAAWPYKKLKLKLEYGPKPFIGQNIFIVGSSPQNFTHLETWGIAHGVRLEILLDGVRQRQSVDAINRCPVDYSMSAALVSERDAKKQILKWREEFNDWTYRVDTLLDLQSLSIPFRVNAIRASSTKLSLMLKLTRGDT